MTTKPYAIRLTTVGRKRPKYLASLRTAGRGLRGVGALRITTTDLPERARGFATIAEATEFVQCYEHKFGFEWEVIDRTTAPVAVVQMPNVEMAK